MLRIKEICKEKGINLQDFANKRLGINYQSLNSIMTGNPTIKTLDNIADKLGVSITELFEEKKEVSVWVEYKGEKKMLSEKDLIKLFD